ncbi:MAG: DUF389 domain-containing protein [Bacteroidota bacterium]
MVEDPNTPISPEEPTVPSPIINPEPPILPAAKPVPVAKEADAVPELAKRPAWRERPEDKQGLGNLFAQLRYVLGLIFGSLRELFLKVINLQSTTDAAGTINSIRSGIVVKGYNIWLLMASAVLACIGLDTDSPAVIIGAMLVSPLMSPILGIGLSVGINDRETLRQSLYNFAVAVGVSLLTAFLYFLVTPLGYETSEMLSRTHPTVLDVMVGFFGGVAGIVAGSRKEKTNAIPGVAIATALMPPLCVAGYGLARGNIPHFAGAFYLFFLNAVFISLSTFLIVRFLKFPLKEKITANLRRNFVRGTAAFVVLLLVPAVWLFIDVIGDQRRQTKIERFLDDKFGSNRIEFSVEKQEYIETDSVNYLRVTVASPIYLPTDSSELYDVQLRTTYGLRNTHLILIQTTGDPNDRVQILNQARQEFSDRLSVFERDRELAFQRQQQIEALKEEMQRMQESKLPEIDIRADIRDMVPELRAVDFGQLRTANLTDTTARKDPNKDAFVFVMRFTWGDSLPLTKVDDRKKMIRDRLKGVYALEDVLIVDVNEPFLEPPVAEESPQ